MSNAWNQYCVAVKHRLKATEMMFGIAQELSKTCKSPESVMLVDMLRETSLYYHMDGMIVERDNYITLIGDDMEANGDEWIYYLAGNLRDKNVFYWLKQRDAIFQMLDECLSDEQKQRIGFKNKSLYLNNKGD